MSAVSRHLRRTIRGRPWLTRVVLACGIAAPTWWVAMDIVGSLRYPGYSYVDQTISELSAEGAPTRSLMLLSGIPYVTLLIVFATGVWRIADGRRAQRITAAVLAGEAVWGFAGGIAFPMATREVIAAGDESLRNQMHAWYGIGMPILFVLAIGFGSRLFGRRFRYYSYATILTMLAFGALMATQTSAMSANESTPWLGVQERVTAYAPMLWFVVLAAALLRSHRSAAPDRRDTPVAVSSQIHVAPR